MTVESHDRLRNPDVREASRAIVRDAHGNPVALFVQVTRDHLFVSVRGQPEFEASLRNMGVADAVVTTVVDPRALPEIVVP